MIEFVKVCIRTLALALLVVIPFNGCSDSEYAGGGTGDYGIRNGKISGYAQKGPFVLGTPVRLFELDDDYVQTGKSFTGTIESDDGAFSMGKINLSNSKVLVEVSGSYWNELSGVTSGSPITLTSVVDMGIEGGSNVNLGTHLARERIMNLVEKGVEFGKAKMQAESEIMDAFFGEDAKTPFGDCDVFSDAPALALSVLFLTLRDDGLMTEAMTKVSRDVRNDGTWDNDTLRTIFADGAVQEYFYSEFRYVRERLKEKSGEHVPAFEKYLALFWANAMGFGTCGIDNEGEIVYNKNVLSKSYDLPFICENSIWRPTRPKDEHEFMIQINTKNFTDEYDGEIRRGFVDSAMLFVFDENKWRVATDVETERNIGCSRGTKGKVFITEQGDFVCDWLKNRLPVCRDGYFKCCDTLEVVAVGFRTPYIFEYDKAALFNPDVEYDSLVDSRDGKVYRTVKIGDQVWMAENLRYGDFYPREVMCTSHAANLKDDCENQGYTYSFLTAMNLKKTSIIGTDTSSVNHQGICPDGWHIPTSTEYESLLDAAGNLSGLKSTRGWPLVLGTNSTGFSLLPTTYYYGGDAYFVLSMAACNAGGSCFWRETAARTMFDGTDIGLGANYENGYAVRCVKD